MRILVLGAGATGGYFGGRMQEAGGDVTFLVRSRRAEQLRTAGLRIQSRFGDVHLAVRTVTREQLQQTYDLILLSSKAYDLDDAVEAIAPAAGPETLIVPLLNGMRHMDLLDRRFGAERVLGGLCLISAVLDPEGTICHLNEAHTIVFGRREDAQGQRVREIANWLSGARFIARASDAILREMWEKWIFIASLAGSTCLMRAAIGDIVRAGGEALIWSLLDECVAIARAQGYEPGAVSTARTRGFLSGADSTLMASMLRDLERGHKTEADHILGDLLSRGGGVSCPLLRTAYVHLRAHEARQDRERGRS